MTMFTPDSRNNDLNGSALLRDFLDDLFQERVGPADASDDVSYSSYSESEDASVSLSTVATDRFNKVRMEKGNDLDSTSSTNALNSSTHHTRRHRFRRSRSLYQRPRFTLSQDNAAGIRTQNRDELNISTYHNNPSSNKSKKFSLSASAYSLGSRTGISNSSVINWRNHRDSRWSNSPREIPNNSLSRVKSYDFGFVNDSMHMRTGLRSKKRTSMRGKRSNPSSNNSINIMTAPRNSRKSQGFSLGGSVTRTIESAVRIVDSASEDSDSDGTEFFDDDEESISSFTDSFATSKGSSTTISTNKTTGSSLDFGSRYKTKAKTLPSSRVAPSRTRSSGDLPRMPRRTSDDSFILDEIFEPLKGKLSGRSFQRNKVRRTMSDDVSIVKASLSTRKDFAKAKQRTSDPFGRWAANIARKVPDSTNNDTAAMPAPPRRIPSLSSRSGDAGNSRQSSNMKNIQRISRRSTGRYSNHSNDSSEPSSDSESEYDFNSSFACDDDSLTATMATYGSATKAGNGSTFKQDALKLLLPHHHSSYHSSSHSHRLSMSIPESLRKLPHNSIHGSSTISSYVNSNNQRRPGKSLHRNSRYR